MLSFRSKRFLWSLALAIFVVVMVTAPSPNAPKVSASNVPQSGVLCTTSSSPNATFSLTATAGNIQTPDGNIIYMWSFMPSAGPFQFPGPVMCVNQGDSVTIILNNTLPEAVSLNIPGLENMLANGVPVQPQFDGSGNLVSLVQQAAAHGGSITYTFTATNPGTYLYESGTDNGKQVQMGLFGALIVRAPSDNPTAYSCAYSCTFTKYKTSTEYIMLLSELDPALHQAVQRGQPYDFTQYHPRYWMINGRSFPDTISPNDAANLPAQPYSALVHINPLDASNPYPALVRYLDAGSLNHPFHPHGENGTIIARDQHPLVSTTNQDLSYENFSLAIGSGQTYDELYSFANQEGYDPNTNPVPVTIPQLQNLTFKNNATWYSGSPYLGYQGILPSGVVTQNQCGEFYQVAHSHALNEVANFDLGFGGMLTLERIDPPQPNNCP